MERNAARLVAVIAVICALMGAASARGEFTLHVEREQGEIQIQASLDVPVDSGIAWEVLTDYNHLAEFVPEMRISRIISAAGDPILLG